MALRLVFAGTPETALPSLFAVAESSHELVGVITRPDAARGRGRQTGESPVSNAARQLGIPVLKPRTPADPEFQARLADLQPDVCPVVAYGSLVPQAALDVAPAGWVNLHFSLLPAWRGAAPVQHAIMRGDDVTGATTFRLEQGLDTGPILGTVTERIRPTDTSGSLLGRLARIGARLLVATLDSIDSGTARAELQSTVDVSLAPKLSPADVRVSWADPALGIDRLIRAATPAPGSWTTFRSGRVKVAPLTRIVAEAEYAEAVQAPGELVVAGPEVFVGTGSTLVVLGDVQPQGKRLMAAADWARGARVATGERFM